MASIGYALFASAALFAAARMQDDTSKGSENAMICCRSRRTSVSTKALHRNNALENLQQVEEDAARESLQN